MTTHLSAMLVVVAASVPAIHGEQVAPHIYDASVRLAVREGSSIGYGSGTLVAVSGSTGLIATCAHCFERVSPGASVSVRFFTHSKEMDLNGTVMSYDKEADVGLVLVEGIRNCVPAPLAKKGYVPSCGEQVVVAGCPHGEPLVVERSEIVKVNRFVEEENYGVAIKPENGCSGGGLFNSRGELIGICNGFAPGPGRGVYAGLSCIYAEIAKMRQQLAQRSLLHLDNMAVETDPPGSYRTSDIARTERTSRGAGIAPTSSSEPTSTSQSGVHRSDTANNPAREVICIVRSTEKGPCSDQMVILKDPSEEFLTALNVEIRRGQQSQK